MMTENGVIDIVDYDPAYALDTVKMWRASMERALDWRDPHTLDEQLAYLDSLVQQHSAYLAIDEEAGGARQVVGLMIVGDGELEQLYVHVDYQGRGIGTRLLDLAKRLSPGGLQLYTFEINEGAQRFYKRYGFAVMGRGVEPEMGLADIRYEWSGSVVDSA